MFWPFYFLKPQFAGLTLHNISDKPDAGDIFHQSTPSLIKGDGIHNVGTKVVINGSEVHPGANYVIRPDGVKIRLDYVEDKQALVDSLEDGFVIERHLIDGDIVIFNRQPSLHRMSVMGHSIRVLPYRTFRLHPAVGTIVFTPYIVFDWIITLILSK